MQLTITLFEQNEKARDIIVNSKQRIKDTLVILDEAGMVRNAAGIDKVQSRRSGEYVDVSETYEEAGIVYGDIIRIVRT